MIFIILIGLDTCIIFYNTIGKTKFYIGSGYYYMYDYMYAYYDNAYILLYAFIL